MQRSFLTYAIVYFLLLFFHDPAFGQYPTTTQFWPEIDLTSKPFGKSTLGLDLSLNRESDSSSNTMFGHQSGLGGKIWFNHFFKSKIKTSAFFESIYNKAAPESVQSSTMEYRIAVQNVYYSPFKRWTLQNRIRVEDRIIENSEGNFVNAVRPRYMIKAIVGINKKVLIQGAMYLLASNEIMLNGGSSVTGHHIFDRNLSQIGLGYCFTDYINLEAQYAYTIRLSPDKQFSEINAFSLTLSFNNIFFSDYFKGYFEKSTP